MTRARYLIAIPLITASLIGVALAQTASVTSAQPVACTMDARQCPDGSWVGRSGPNCTFACPGTTVPACPVISHDLSRGTTNASVTDLQNFLATQGFFSQTSIGIFGPATFNAVVSFQKANGVSATGYVGPLTRAMIAKRCGTPTPVANAVKIYSITPTSGPTGTQVTIDGFGFTSDNTIHFGSGVIPHVAVSGQIAIACTNDPSCIGGIHQTLTFTVPTGLNPACFYSEPRCMVLTRMTTPGPYDVSVQNANGTSNSRTFTVTGVTTGNAPRIDSENPVQGPVGTSVTLTGAGFTSDMVVRFADGSVPHTTSADGTSVTFTIPQGIGAYCQPNQACPMYMRLVTPGSYDVYVQNIDGSIVSNKVSFMVTGNSSGSTLSVNGIDAPSTLAMGTSGTWTVHTSASSASPNLHYSVVWGDENTNFQSGIAASPATTVQTTSTFTHTYQRSGSYTPTFTVSDDFGHSATVSSGVTVTPLY